MLDWLTQTFGSAIADIRDKVVFDGFFGLKTPERRGHDLPGASHDADAPEQSILDWLYEQDPSLFNDPEEPAREQDRGIDL